MTLSCFEIARGLADRVRRNHSPLLERERGGVQKHCRTAMLKSIECKAKPDIGAERPQSVVAFDGDDTLWIDDTDEKRWERDCKRLSTEGLPHPGIREAFRRRLRQCGYTPEGVQRALIESAREICDRDIPADWRAQVEAIPQCMDWLTLRCPPGLESALTRLQEAGHALWIITHGDLIRQAMKLACFPFLDRFGMVEIVDRKNAATYARIAAANGCAPAALTMVGDRFFEDVGPVVRLGGRGIHVPNGRWAMLRRFDRFLPTRRIRVCRTIAQVPEAIAAAD
jgi:putative hydrolase of the HAD superfamily